MDEIGILIDVVGESDIVSERISASFGDLSLSLLYMIRRTSRSKRTTSRSMQMEGATGKQPCLKITTPHTGRTWIKSSARLSYYKTTNSKLWLLKR